MSSSNLKWIFDSMFLLQALVLVSNVYVQVAEFITTKSTTARIWLVNNYPTAYQYLEYTYDKSNIIRRQIEYIIFAKIFRYHREPLESEWTSIVHISPSNTLIETYDTEYKSTSLLRIVKSDGNYWFQLQSMSNKLYICNPSNVKFISVEYTHPDITSGPLYFEIPRSYYIVGNHLFSNTFILRYLKYYFQQTVIFDERYVLRVMDNNINTVELRWDDYCILGENAYNITSRTDTLKKCD